MVKRGYCTAPEPAGRTSPKVAATDAETEDIDQSLRRPGAMDLDALRWSSLQRLRVDGLAREAAASVPGLRATEPAAPAQRQADERMMRRAIDEANRVLTEKGRELTFEFSNDVGRVIVRLIDRRTGEVLRQIPSPEMVEIARLLDAERASGALLRANA
jgi:flagellar protein FlaG